MARILTGTQSTGRPHLGNLLGAMLPGLELANNPKHESFFFIADLHTLTTIKEAHIRKNYTYATAAAWLSLGLDPAQTTFYRQSKVPEVCELTWYLSCFVPYPMLANAHAFKDKAKRLATVSAGLFTYPVLMAADILLYDIEMVAVGQDQMQHIEMARDIVNSFNHQCGPTLILPRAAQIGTAIPVVPGTDGQKMSKSYHNTIDVFLPEKALKKTIMAIATDSTPLMQPKDPNKCIVFQLYRLLASEPEVTTMRQRYQAGGYGYGHAKQALLGVILDRFSVARQRFDRYMNDLSALDEQLAIGEAKAQTFAAHRLQKVRQQLGY